ncbi:acyl-CoA dehydrogenase family protein [Rhodococcus sp. NPDC004095]
MSEIAAELTSATTSIVDRIGVDLRTPASGWDHEIWDQLQSSGFATVAVSEDAGGGGGDLADALAVVSVSAQRGALTPLIEHGVLAAWIAASAGHTLTSSAATAGVATMGNVRSDGDRLVLDGAVTEVAFAAEVDTIVVVLPPDSGADGSTVAIVPVSGPGVSVSSGTDLTGISLADVTFEDVPVSFHGPSTLTVDEVVRRGAVAYAAALAGAARSVHDHTLRHASERIQFGRPLAKFQAVQQRLAQQAALTTMTEIAVGEAIASGAPDAIAAAKVVASDSAHPIAAAAHQIHGAIGTTSEHRLGRFTTSLWSWRDRHGSERFWADELARRVLDEGVDVWDLVVGTGDTTNERSSR